MTLGDPVMETKTLEQLAQALKPIDALCADIVTRKGTRLEEIQTRFLKQWHIDLLELALHKRCLTSAISGGAQSARRLLIASFPWAVVPMQAA